MKKRTEFQDYLGEFYSERKKPLYYAPKLSNPLGKFAKEMITMLLNNDIVGFQQKAKEAVEWKAKRK